MARVALVTGAGGGIGRAVADRLSADGMRVAVAGPTAPTGGDLALTVDVTDATSVAAMVAEVTERLGAPEVLVTCAGVITAAPFTELTQADWDRVLAVNLTGTFLCCQAVLPAMRKRGWGRIITIASDAGKTGEPYIAHYCASKFGVIGLTQSLALEYATEGITVNSVCPAITDTPMMDLLAREMEATDVAEPPGGWRATFVEEIPMGRPMLPEDVADACAYLASEGAAAMTGQSLNVSGGHEVH
jgi:NAD(P)-dependent dehydrogenase (short-subunit alcohol dehydrogenase family)